MSTSRITDFRARELAWHYTTLESLQLILESRSLLATEVSYQNDPREPETANDAIRSALRQIADDPEYTSFAKSAELWHEDWFRRNGFIAGKSGELIGTSRFIFCASSDPDNLYAWRTYAAGSRTGCAIGLDPLVPLGFVTRSRTQSYGESTQWKSVVYDETELVLKAVELLTKVGDRWNSENDADMRDVRDQEARGVPSEELQSPDNAFGVLITDFSKVTSEITAIAKHGSFKDELEMRVTISGAESGVVFSPGASGPRPRVRLATASSWGQALESAQSRLPIRAVVLAPSATREAATTAQWLLYANGYPLDPVFTIDESGKEPVMYDDSSETVELAQSEHPYRDV